MAHPRLIDDEFSFKPNLEKIEESLNLLIANVDVENKGSVGTVKALKN